MIRDSIDISSDDMTAVYGGAVIATARYSKHATADGNGAWIVSTHPARLFGYNDAITALTLAERLAVGYGDDDPRSALIPFVMKVILPVGSVSDTGSALA
jgi:hypothetical protein